MRSILTVVAVLLAAPYVSAQDKIEGAIWEIKFPGAERDPRRFPAMPDGKVYIVAMTKIGRLRRTDRQLDR